MPDYSSMKTYIEGAPNTKIQRGNVKQYEPQQNCYEELNIKVTSFGSRENVQREK